MSKSAYANSECSTYFKRVPIVRVFVITLLSFLATQKIFAQQFNEKAAYYDITHSLGFVNNLFGAGVSFFDFDDDGWDDLTLVGVNSFSSFYRNTQGTFLPAPFSLFTQGDVKQLIWVDYDNDGDYDLAYSTRSGGAFKLFRNDGNWQFTDVTASAGFLGLNTENYGFSFADYDKDGNLDMYLCRYHGSGNPSDPLMTNALYRNNGDGTFSNVTSFAGVGNGIATSFIGIWIDYNDDTWPDLYVINDRTPFINTLYKNNGDGTFTDVTIQTNTAMAQLNGQGDEPMSGTFEDFDHDGDLDIYASNTGSALTLARLLVNQGGVNFTEEAVQRGVALDEWAWGATFVDIDNDSWQDLYVTTATISSNVSTDVRSYMYKSNAAVTFTDAPDVFINHSNIAASYSVAKGDINNDGFADLVVANGKNVPSYIWENTATSSNNYVKITLQGTISNRMAIGSWIKLYVQNNVFSHYTRCGENYCSQNSQHHIFGLAQHTLIDSIVVTYLSGIKDKYYNVDVNQHLYFVEGETLLFEIENSGLAYLCPGSQITLSAPDFEVYAWNTGDSTQMIAVTQPGSYYLTAWNAAGHTYFSDTVEVIGLQQVSYNANVAHVSCFELLDGSIALDVQTQALNYEITWSNGFSGNPLESIGSGVYSFTYLDEYGCELSDDVFVFEPDAISLFTQITPQDNHVLGTLQLLAVGGQAPYQFFIDGNPAPTFSALESGTYTVSVVDALGCTHSIEVVIPFDQGLGLSRINPETAILFPNPVTRPFLLTVETASQHSISEIYLYDASGRCVLTKSIVQNNENIQLDLQQIAGGFYTLAIHSGSTIEFHKIQVVD